MLALQVLRARVPPKKPRAASVRPRTRHQRVAWREVIMDDLYWRNVTEAQRDKRRAELAEEHESAVSDPNCSRAVRARHTPYRRGLATECPLCLADNAVNATDHTPLRIGGG